MADITIYVPDKLRAQVRAAGLPVSRICQQALSDALGEHNPKPPANDRRAYPGRRP